jgi:hypothetical protein
VVQLAISIHPSIHPSQRKGREREEKTGKNCFCYIFEMHFPLLTIIILYKQANPPSLSEISHPLYLFSNRARPNFFWTRKGESIPKFERLRKW